MAQQSHQTPTLLHVSSQLAVGFDLDMTLIDTVPGFAAVLRALGRGARCRVPGRGADLEARPAAGPDAGAAPAGRPGRPGGGPVPGAVPRARRRRHPRPARRARGARRGPPPPGPGRRGHRQVRPNAQRHIDHLALDVDLLEGWVWGVGKAEVLRREGVSIYVGDHVHDVDGARAAGVLSVSVLTGGCTREELEDAGTDVVLDEPRGVPRMARRAPAADPARGAGARPPGAGERDGRLQRRRGQRVPARRGGPRARTRPRASPRPATATRCPQVERDPARDFAAAPRRRAAHARDPRDGARGLPRQRRRPLLLLQGRADRRAHPARAGPRHRDRRDRHERRRRGGRLPARASAPPTSAAPSRRCATPGSPRRRSARPRTGGGCRRGTSPPPRACPRGWRTASRSRRTGWPAWSAPRPRSATCSPAVRPGQPAGPRPRRPRLGRGGPGLLPLAEHRHADVVAAVRAAGFDEVVVDEKGFRSGSMNERLA